MVCLLGISRPMWELPRQYFSKREWVLRVYGMRLTDWLVLFGKDQNISRTTWERSKVFQNFPRENAWCSWQGCSWRTDHRRLVLFFCLQQRRRADTPSSSGQKLLWLCNIVKRNRELSEQKVWSALPLLIISSRHKIMEVILESEWILKILIFHVKNSFPGKWVNKTFPWRDTVSCYSFYGKEEN